MKVTKKGTMDVVDEWLELLVFLVVVGALMVMGGTFFNQYLDKARLTLSVAALNKAQDTLKNYKAMHRSFPASLDFSNCSNQDHRVVLNCDEIKADINSFVSYVGTAETFVLKAKAKDSRGTFIVVTESTISY
jgi:type II secretory pathway pseudopilin PulG